MEAWQLEELRQMALGRKKRLTCDCCGEPVATSRYLRREPFGVAGLACERGLGRHMRWCYLCEGGA